MSRSRFNFVAGVSLLCMVSCIVFWGNKIQRGRVSKLAVFNKEVRKRKGACNDSLVNTNSTCFRDKVDFSVYPLWTEKSLTLDNNVYKWWMSLQRWKDDNLKDAMNEIFEVGVPRDPQIERLDDRCTTCAVVGNSNNLLDHTYGEFIDKHAHVIRFNGAVTEGYEKYVGKKWTYLFLYPETNVPKVHTNTFVVHIPFKPPDLRWLASALGGKPYKFNSRKSVSQRLECNISKVLVLNPGFMSYVHSDWMEKKGVQPSTGILGIIFAIHHCDKVNVFGFGADSKGRWLHYFDENPDKGDWGHAPHDDGAEKRLISSLEKDGIITFYR